MNRGWVPFSHKKAILRTKGQIENEVDLIGVIRLTEPRPVFTPKNKADVRVWFTR